MSSSLLSRRTLILSGLASCAVHPASANTARKRLPSSLTPTSWLSTESVAPKTTKPEVQATKSKPQAPAVQKRAVIDANELRLRLYQANAGWNYNDVLWAEGELDTRAYRDLNTFMRDWRDGYALKYSHDTAKVLALSQQQSGNRLLHIYSGVRSKHTNNMLRAKSSGVAKNSFHLYGRAADARFDGLSTPQTARLFRLNGGGGVKHYLEFAHIDDGPRRTW